MIKNKELNSKLKMTITGIIHRSNQILNYNNGGGNKGCMKIPETLRSRFASNQIIIMTKDDLNDIIKIALQ